MPVFDHFGLLAPYYDRFFERADHSKLFSLLDLPQGGVLLDAGGGTGRVSQVFHEQVQKIVVADESVEMLKIAREKPRLSTSQSKTEQLPFSEGTFDGVIMVDALHHVADQKRTIQELWRVLRPNGRLVIEEPNIHRFSVKILALIEKLFLMRSHFLSPAEILKLVPGGYSDHKILHDGIISWVMVKKGEKSRK